MEKIEVILTNCIEEIRSGRSTLDQCLRSYPFQRQEIEPLLKMALNIQEPRAFGLDPVYKQSAKAQLLRQITTTQLRKSHSIADIFSFGLPPQLLWARIAVAAVIGIIVISMIGGGTAFAAQSSIPGDLLYPVKINTEDIRLWMATNRTEKANLNLEFSQTRLVEISKLANKGSDKIDLAVNEYQENLQAAVSDTQNITDTSIVAGILERFSQRLENQISFSDQVIDINPAYSELIQRANDIAVNQQIKILNRLAPQNKLQAAQANLNMMQNRLQRAQVKADEHQYQLMQEIMIQYQKFDQLGLQILQDAQSTQNQATEIDNLSAGALQDCLGTLDSLSKQIPQEYKSVLETSQQMTLQFQNQTRYRYQNQEGSGQGPNLPSSDNNSNSTIEQSPTPTPQPQGDTGSPMTDSPVSSPTSGGNTDNGNGMELGGTNAGGDNANGSNGILTPGPSGGENAGSDNGTPNDGGAQNGPTPVPGSPH